ncbi:HAD-IA family hydrolase [Roseixanthobacter glucoisosaccharinicivorans]|uniref:HAD-IA family hydrolase n=1 Tax=Roseixanthobacter glucoisosaccharinicivorans TaxID=3119923 RepID=UPI0037278894
MADIEGASVVFDLDGTMVDTAPDIIDSVNEALASLSFSAAPPALILPGVSRGAEEMLRLGLAFNGVAADPEILTRGIDRFLAHYEANIAVKSAPYPGLREVCERLTQAGAKLGVCTNKRHRLASKLLKNLNLDDLFLVVAGRDTFAKSKPHPSHLLNTIQELGGDPRRAVMVGDSDVDINTAVSANIPIIHVSFGYGPLSSDRRSIAGTIDHFNELELVIREIFYD